MKRTIIIFLALMLMITFTFNGVYADDTESADTPTESISSDQTATDNSDISVEEISDETKDTEPEVKEPAADEPAAETEEPAADEPAVEIAKPVRQVIKSLQPGNKKLTVQWTPDPREDACYEIRIAEDSKFTQSVVTVTRKAPKDMLTKIRLVNGNIYYVKVRTYYKIDGKRYNGRWSKIKSVKVHKTAKFSNTSIKGVPEIRTLKTKDDGDLLVLVNKYHAVSKNYAPSDMVKIPASYGMYNNMRMKKVAFKAYKKMLKAAKKEGLNFKICSAYRSYSIQRSLFNNYIYSRGYKRAFMLSAYPGRSEHHTGLAIDILTGRNGWVMGSSFGKTKEGKWLKKHCAEYGFILRYLEGKEEITGYQYEPWHFRYVGKKKAKEIMEKEITLEEYLGKTP